MKKKVWGFITSFIMFLWFPIVEFWGDALSLTDKNTSELSWVAIIITVVIFIFVIVYNIVMFVKENNPNKDDDNIHRDICLSLMEVYRKEHDDVISFVLTNKDKMCNVLFYNAYNPSSHIHRVLHEIQALLSSVAKISRNNIVVTLAYKYEYDDWRWLEGTNVEYGLDLDILVEDERSVFHQALHSEDRWAYHSSKKEAKLIGKYIDDEKDTASHRGKRDGSILCLKIICSQNTKHIVTAILNISTYGRKVTISSIAKDHTERFLRDDLLQPYATKIRYELAIQYAKDMASKNPQP